METKKTSDFEQLDLRGVIANPPFDGAMKVLDGASLTEGQRNFFEAKQRIIDEITPANETEIKLKGLAQLLLNSFNQLQAKANRIAAERTAATERAMKAEMEAAEARHLNADKFSKAFGAMVACYRAIDRHFGDEIREHLKKNFETQDYGLIKMHLAEIERLTNGTNKNVRNDKD